MLRKEIRNNKFAPSYNKPIEVIEPTGRNNVILKLPSGELLRKHVNKVKLIPNPHSSDFDPG